MSENLLHNLPLRDSHLRAVLTAIVEMDLSDLSSIEHDCLNAYLNKFTLQNRICTRDTTGTSSQDVILTVETENCTELAVRDLSSIEHDNQDGDLPPFSVSPMP